jgi:hypothetical protein
VGVQPIGVMRPKSPERSSATLERPRSPPVVNNAFMVETQKVTLREEDVEAVKEGLEKLEAPALVNITCTDPAAIRDKFTSIPNSFGYSRVREVELVNHFFPPEWRGVLSISPAGELVALSSDTDNDGETLWQLGSGEYTIIAQRKRVLVSLGGTSFGKMGLAKSFSARSAGPSRSFHTAALSLGARAAPGMGRRVKPASGEVSSASASVIINRSARGVGERRSGGGKGLGGEMRVDEETTWAMPWGVEKSTQKKAGEDEVMGKKTRGGIVDLEGRKNEVGEEGRKNEGVGEERRSMEVASEKEDEGRTLGKQERTSVVKKVLLRNTCRDGNKLIHVLKEVEEKRVESLGGPVNGDCVAVFEKDNMLSRKIRDTDFWLPGKTTTMAIGVEGVRVRHWKCGGGKVCRNADCFYLQRTKKQNNSSFIRRGGDSWVCFYCKKEAAPLVTLGRARHKSGLSQMTGRWLTVTRESTIIR